MPPQAPASTLRSVKSAQRRTTSDSWCGRFPIRLWPLHWPRHGRWTSGNVPLLSALAAFAVPAAFGVAQPLPTVFADATQPGLGHSGLLVGEPFRLGQGHPEGPDAGEHPRCCCSPTETLGCYQPSVQVAAEKLRRADLGSGDDDQDDAHPGPVASSTSDAMGGTRVACSRSVPSSKATIVWTSLRTQGRPCGRPARPQTGRKLHLGTVPP